MASASLRALVTARVFMGDVNDPFYLVKEEISDTVAKAQTTSERLARLPAGNGERDKLAASVATECESVLWQLEELDRATAMAENDYARFKVDATELASRKRWTASTKRTVEGMRADAQRVLDARTARGGGYGGGLDGAIGAANDSFLDSQHDQQQLLVRKQDEDLDDISVSIQRIGQVGLTIGEELETQGKMLEELEENVEGTNSRLAAAQRKMNAVLKKAGAKGQMAIIAVLTVLLVILFVIAFG